MDYFVDTNIIIDFFNKRPSATKILEDHIEQEHILHINELVRLEALRTIDVKKTKIFRESNDFLLAYFKMTELNREIYNQAIELSRYCKSKGICLKGRCEAIDFLHFITAKYYQFTLLTNDGDIEKLENVYLTWLDSQAETP
jgi:predicted nucleic acid-binding protein